MSLIVFYKGANQHSVSAGPEHRVVLNPGQNVVEKEVWDKIVSVQEKLAKKSGKRTGVLHLIDEKLVKVIGEGEEDEDFSFDSLNQKDAIDLIGTEASIDNLDEYYIVEADGKNRPKVIEAIDAQIEKIKKADQSDADLNKS